MRSVRTHRCALLLATLALISVATGAAVTSNEERPYYSVGQTHYWFGFAVAALTIALAILIQLSDERPWLRRLGWITVAALCGEAFAGMQPLPQPPAFRIAHALLGQAFVALTFFLALCTSNDRTSKMNGLEAPSWLWSMAAITPCVVLGQVALGTLFRHGATGIGPHLLGAFVVVFFMLGMAMPVVSKPEYRSLFRRAAIFLAIASAQVLLGFALFIMGMMDADPSLMILVTMIHAAIGALTLAATVLLAALIRRGGSPEPKAPAGERSAPSGQ